MKFLQGILLKGWVLPAAVLLCCAIYIVYPGGFTPDSDKIYAQATKQAELTNAKPVFSVLLMRAAVHLLGHGGFVVVNSLMYFLGAGLICAALFRTWIARCMALLLLVAFPPLLLANLSNWIDAAENAALVVCIGLTLLFLFRARNPYLLIGALLFSVYALLTRHNAPSTVFFFQAFIALLLTRHYGWSLSQRRQWLVGTGVVAGIFSLSLTVNPLLEKLLGAENEQIAGWLYVNDLVGLSLLTNENLIPPGLLTEAYRDRSDGEILAALESVYSPSSNYRIWGIVHHDLENEYRSYALHTMLQNPGGLALIRYRTNVAWLTVPMTAYTIHSYPTPRHERLGIPTNRGRPGLARLASLAKACEGTPLFVAGWYLLWLLLLLAGSVGYLAATNRDRLFARESSVLIVLALAGIFTWLPLVPITASAEFRYLLPAVLCSVVALLILLRVAALALLERIRPGASEDDEFKRGVLSAGGFAARFVPA